MTAQRPRRPTIPRAQGATVRRALLEALEALPDEARLTARELSQAVGIPERRVPEELEHLGRSLRAEGRRLVTEPPRCLACEYFFPGRERLTRPGKCPRCDSTRIGAPRFGLLA